MFALIKQAGIISAADFLRLFVKTVIGFILARLLTQADFGSYRQLFMIYTLLSSIFMIGIPQSIYYFVPKASEKAKKAFIAQTVDLFTILGLACTLALFLGRAQIAVLFHNPKLNPILMMYAFYPVFMFLSQLYYTVMIGLQQPRKAAIFVVFSLCCDFLMILSMAFLTHRLGWIVAGQVLSVSLQWLFARVSLNRWTQTGKLFNIDRALLKKQMAYSYPIGIAAVVGVVTSQLDKLVISTYFSPEMFAIFSIGAAELPFIGIITNSINAVLLPAMSCKTDQCEIVKLYCGAVRKNALILLPIFTFSFVFAPHLIHIMYSAKYVSAVPYFRIYLLTMPLRIATYGIIFQVFDRTKYISILAGLTLALSVVFNLLFIRVLGTQGPAIATVISTYFNVGLSLIIFKKALHLHITEVFPLPHLIRILGTAVIAGVLSHFIVYLHIHPYLQLSLGGVCFLALYWVLGNLLGAILPYDRHMLWEAWLRVKKRLEKQYV